MSKKKISFIVNPISGTIKGKRFENEIKDVFSPENYKLEILYTSYRGHASEIAQSLRNDNIIIVVVGGDGTVNEVAKELLNSDTAILGIIPMGSGNGLARTLGLPLDLKKALQRIKNGTRILIDTCSFNGIPFFCTAGIAFDAAVAKDFDNLPSRGLRTYFQASYRQFIKHEKRKVSIRIDDKLIEEDLFMFTIANAEQYGYGAKISPNSSLTDGIIELVLVKDLNLAQLAEFTLRLFLGNVHKLKGARIIKTDQIVSIKTDSKIAHLDGEPISFDGQVDIKVHKKSLAIIS